MGVIIKGTDDTVKAADGSLSIEGFSIKTTGIGTFDGGIQVGSAATIHSNGNLGLTGIITATNFKTGDSNVHNTGYNVGTAVTIDGNTGNVALSGIITASSFSGIDLGAVTGATGDFSIADKIVHTGDTNTTIRFPSADTFTVETASQERFLIRADGRVSIASSLNVTGVCTAAAFVPREGWLGNRRININGAMQIWQRSISATDIGGSNGYFACDRYRSSNNGAARHTISRDTDTPTGEGFGHSMKIDVTTANASPSANNYTFIQHRIEGQDVAQFAKGTAGAKQYALSFWVKSPKTGVHVIQWEDVENSRSVQGTYTIASADTWEKHTIIFPAETSNGITGDNSHRMQLYFWLFAGSTYNNGNVASLGTTWASTGSISRASGQVNVFDNTSNNFYITGIQFEVGSYATPFEHALYDDELRKCQVYFNMIGDGTNFGQNKALSDAFMWGTTECDFMYTFPTEMRSTPSIYQVTGSNYFRIQGGGHDTHIDGNFTMQYQNKRSTSQYATSDASRNAGASCHITVQNSAARYGYNAEL